MGLTPVSGSHRLHDGVVGGAREIAPMLAVLALPAALVLGLALYGGQQQQTAATPTLGPYEDFRFEQIGVGVKRLVDDGAGHRPGDRSFIFKPVREVVAFEPDGSVLLCCRAPGLILTDRSKTELHRLGEEGPVHRWDDDGLFLQGATDMAVAPDGTTWVAGPGLASLDADGWTSRRSRNQSEIVEIAADGTVWADASGKSLKVLQIRGAKQRVFTPVDGLPPATRGWDPVITGIAATPDGNTWVGVGSGTAKRPDGGLLRYDGQRWKVVRPLGRGVDAKVDGVTASEDGTLWVYLSRARGSAAGPRSSSSLAIFDGGDWTVFDEDDGVPHHGAGGRYQTTVLMEAGLDGRVWLTPVGRGGCRSLMSFRDGVTTDYLDRGACIHDFEIAADGTAWAMVEQLDDWRIDLYLVTP